MTFHTNRGSKELHILILTQVFPPEVHPTAVMVRELSQYLASSGHRVTVACGYPHHPSGNLMSPYGRKSWKLHERLGNVDVLRGWHITSPSRRFTVRALIAASQTLGTLAVALEADKPDIVMNFGPPIAGPLASILVARRFGAKALPVIYDLYPDIAVETGRLKNKTVVGLLSRFADISYAMSDRVVVLSDGFKRDLISRGVAPEKIDIVPVWLDPNEIRPLDRSSPWRQEQGISDEQFVVLYAGTIGLVSGARIMLDVADEMRNDQDVLFVFVGEGQVKDDLMAAARDRRLENVRFFPFQPRNRLPEIQACSDVSVVTLAPGMGRTSVPSKVTAYMAAGRPIVASVDATSDTGKAVEQAGCGLVTKPGSHRELADAIRLLRSEPERRRALGRAARAYFERHYSRPSVLARFQSLLEAMI